MFIAEELAALLEDMLDDDDDEGTVHTRDSLGTS